LSGAATLTQMQLLGLASETNVAEGYPRFAFTQSQQAIVDRFPSLMAEANEVPFSILETRAHRAFFGALGQTTAPIGSGRILSFYSSTIAIDVIAACLARVATTVGVIHPTLDCVPALFGHRGLRLIPVAESRLSSNDPLHGLEDAQALFVASPNNPTGTVLSPVQLRRLADACAARDVVLVIDSCFRAFDPRAQFDMYAVLDASGVEYVVIEDSGKLWPVGGIKLGFLAAGPRTRLALTEVASDILLTAPPFSAAMVEAFALDMAAGGLERLHARIAENRAILARELAGCPGATLVDPDSRASVARIRLDPPRTGTRLWGQLLRHGVHSVPCRPFYWARPRTGERYLRIALAREPDVVERAARAVRACLEESGAA
jgi:aspartate/methionine/tyrosine aminotransferase